MTRRNRGFKQLLHKFRDILGKISDQYLTNSVEIPAYVVQRGLKIPSVLNLEMRTPFLLNCSYYSEYLIIVTMQGLF